MATSRRKSQEVIPELYFAGWAYPIPPHHWDTLGVEKREFVNKVATKALREAARAQGKTPQQVLRTKLMRKVWVYTGMVDFHEFDLFWSANGDHAIQIISIKDMIEIHRVSSGKPRLAYLVTEKQLIECLKDGHLPEQSRIWQGRSQSEILRFSIQNPDYSGIKDTE